nr:hypothetical protein [Tanacetum cinerariifolium]
MLSNLVTSFNRDFGAVATGMGGVVAVAEIVVVEMDADGVAGFGTEPGVAESAEALTLFAQFGCWDETGGLAQMMDGIRPLVHRCVTMKEGWPEVR